MLKSKLAKLNIKYIAPILLIGLGSLSFGESDLFKLSKNIEIFANVYKAVNETYVDEVEPAGLMRIALDAMLAKCDPYTNYISNEQIEISRLQRSAGGGDIGVDLVKIGDDITISEVIEGLPAHEAGLKPGDIIRSIDGETTNDRTLEDIKIFLKGQPDTEVSLGLVPYGQDAETEQSIGRVAIKPQNVTFSKMLNDTVGYVKLSTFLSRGCSGFVEAEITKLKEENENFKYLVFDLRNNPGGFLNEAVYMCNLFLPQGSVVVTRSGRDPDETIEDKCPKEPVFPDLPLVVLVNNKSASASEIVSGTMQDYDRGVVIGQQSYGKGLVQQTKDLPFKSRVKLTVAKYYTASGRCVQAVDYYGDYTDDGAKEIPDSLKNSFKTVINGRTVYDNSGVTPDLEIEKQKYGSFVEGLQKEQAVFQYANYYASNKDSIVSPLSFEITDADFADFVDFVAGNEIDFKTDTEKSINQLQETTKEEEYYTNIEGDLSALQNKVKSLQKSEINSHKKELKKLLKYEILKRYYYEKGRLEASLNDDPDVNAAFDLFADMNEYNSILGY